MTTLEAETDVENTVEETQAVEMVDCGRASEQTRGFSALMLFEGGIPPHDRLF